MHEERDAFLAALKAKTGQWPDFEGLIRDIYMAFLKGGDLAIDVGVNEGHHLVQMAQAVGPTGKVIGVEAYGPMCKAVLDNVDNIYPELKTRIDLRNVAVSRKPGNATFYFDRSFTGLSSLAKRDISQGHDIEAVKVKVTTLDKLVKDRPAFVKIDIEGAEYDALCGASRMLRTHPLIAFEFDASSPTYFGYKPEDLVGLFHAQDYRIVDLFGHPHETATDLMSAPLWNFLAIPEGMDAETICAPARKAL